MTDKTLSEIHVKKDPIQVLEQENSVNMGDNNNMIIVLACSLSPDISSSTFLEHK